MNDSSSVLWGFSVVSTSSIGIEDTHRAGFTRNQTLISEMLKKCDIFLHNAKAS